MSSKDSQSKTSKTARVMNLISKKTDSASAADSAENKSAPVPPIISSLAPEAEAASQIRNALEDELAGTVTSPAPEAPPAEAAAPRPEPVTSAPAPEIQSAPPAEAAAPAPVPVTSAPAPEVQSTPPAEAAAPAPEPVTPVPEPEARSTQPAVPENPRFLEPENPGYINVMQVLVEEKAPVYIKISGMCQCKRCLEDVKALTLNHLPPKYVVLAEHDRVPRLTVYEGRFSSDITSQLIQACEFVKLRPHHSRKD